MAKKSISTETASILSVPEGKIIDFLTKQFFNDTPEEYVRQNIEKALVRQYKYLVEDMFPEFSIKVGSANKRVDIVVFEHDKPHKQENAYLIVETKKANTNPHGKKDGIEQLKSYMAACLNAKFGFWTNGDDRYCFAKREKDGSFYFEEIPEIPAYDQDEDDLYRPERKNLQIATADNLMFAFRRCHNYIAGNAGMHKTDAFWELLKIIFAKIEDERSNKLTFYVTPEELKNSSSALSTKKRIDGLFENKVVKKYPMIFNSDETRTIELSPEVLAYVVSQLQGYSLLASPVDVKGIAYEEIVGSNLRGDRGEFFTPRNACRMAVEMLRPQPGEKVIDPACGTGGFLITAMNHALKVLQKNESELWANKSAPTPYEIEELYRKRTEYLSTCVYGLDLNPALVRAAKMNMVMNNDGSGGLFRENSLANPHTWSTETNKNVQLGSFDLVFTNPPFGANILIDDVNILSQYDLACTWDKQDDGAFVIRKDKVGEPVLQSSQPPEILFIERCIKLLKPGTGRMAMVIPNGILNNPSLEYVRYWILHNVRLLAVVDMQRDLFQPGNDTQTSMVLMRRFSEEEVALSYENKIDYPVFMAVAEKIGHDKRGVAIYKRDAEGNEIVSESSNQEESIDPVTGQTVIFSSDSKERVIDDDTVDVPKAYKKWQEEHL
ncbi:N-6 DNA methylase [Butyrivibrio sp. XB500-5]|uniref:N-6 DNA methylase n=1 Tax=Butyrivibrio sp. XB500-5 TaxID=2364880 RepID=UPI000EA90CB5|nr:N-6 DNA methylase [Butyrivibrio sp. XB500-5]RKM61538.1 N-6 DNA methylase [Butyrivibrio sp. XB500-5]